MLRAMMRPEAPGAAEERVRDREAARRAHADMLAAFSPLTPANAHAAIEYQRERHAFHLGGLA